MKFILNLMFGWLKPDIYCDSIFFIDKDFLEKNKIKYLIVDLDNTIVPWGETEITQKVKNWMSGILSDGIKVCVLSNNNEERASGFAAEFGLDYVAWARKPSKKAFKKALDKLDAEKDQTAVVGDQIFTDILGGKRAGIFTILVIPLSKREFFGTRFVRIVERFVLRALY